MMLTGKKTFIFQHTFVEEDVENYIEQVGKQVISIHEQVCKSSESLYMLQGFYKIM